MSKAALSAIGDITAGEAGPCNFFPTVIMRGSPTVLVNGRPAATVGSNVFPHFCFIPGNPPTLVTHTNRYVSTGSPVVLINGTPAAHIGSLVTGTTIPSQFPPCADTITSGSPTVLVAAS